MRNLVTLLLILLPFAVAAAGGALTTPEIPGWYASLPKPRWNPPAWVFGPVWTTLYALMAVAGALVYRAAGVAHPRGVLPAPARLPLALHLLQLSLNLAWSFLFFRLHSPALALADIVLLLAVLLATAWAFARVNALAGWLMAPYLAWVAFAAVLNASIVALS